MSISPIQFLRQVKQEAKKVTWPTKKEVVPSCTMVIDLVAVATAFFFAVDIVLSWGVDKFYSWVRSFTLLRVGML